MYIQKTKFYCVKCRTHDHWANERCPEDVSKDDRGVGIFEGETGGKVSKRERGGEGDATLPSWKDSEGEFGSNSDSWEAELSGKEGHQKTQEGKSVVSGKGNPVQIAQEFIKKVGRPKVYPDRKTQMRELMRRKRASKRAKVLGDVSEADVSKSKPE